MDTIIRGTVVYLFVFVIFRVAGKRTLSQATVFDLVLVLLISETTQQAMVGSDHSLTNSILLIMTLVGWDVALSLVKFYLPVTEPLLDGNALILLKDGKLQEDRLRLELIHPDDILEAARNQLGLENLSQVKMAVLEKGGKISIVPWEKKV
ncbi:MAG: DUF421 domain-containing protein [Pirellulales bacterium]|nr:DUF421 domain-containing protein [Pirellulales bacterium]